MIGAIPGTYNVTMDNGDAIPWYFQWEGIAKAISLVVIVCGLLWMWLRLIKQSQESDDRRYGNPDNLSRLCGQQLGNRRCPGYSIITMTAAICTKARKFAAFFSYRVATRRNCFAFDQNRSTRFRSL